MVAKYYVAIGPRTNKNHPVHKEGCPFLPDGNKRIYLGAFNSERDALREARNHFVRTDNCRFCSKELRMHREQPVPGNQFIMDLISEEIRKESAYSKNLICCLN